MTPKRTLKITMASIVVIALLFVGLYALIQWEGSSAREDAPALEAARALLEARLNAITAEADRRMGHAPPVPAPTAPAGAALGSSRK